VFSKVILLFLKLRQYLVWVGCIILSRWPYKFSDDWFTKRLAVACKKHNSTYFRSMECKINIPKKHALKCPYNLFLISLKHALFNIAEQHFQCKWIMDIHRLFFLILLMVLRGMLIYFFFVLHHSLYSSCFICMLFITKKLVTLLKMEFSTHAVFVFHTLGSSVLSITKKWWRCWRWMFSHTLFGSTFGPNIISLTTRLGAIRKTNVEPYTFLVFQNFCGNVHSHKHIVDNIKRFAGLHLSKHLVSLNKIVSYYLLMWGKNNVLWETKINIFIFL
jgi:hypothetical protein